MQEEKLKQADLLAEKLSKAKATEEQAKKGRIALENELAQLIGAPEAGQTSRETERYKIVLRGGVSQKADFEAMRETGIPEHMLPIRLKPELDPKGLTWLQKNKPAEYQQVLATITTTPKKVAVTVTLKEVV